MQIVDRYAQIWPLMPETRVPPPAPRKTHLYRSQRLGMASIWNTVLNRWA
jgi:hypothetical protein